MVYQIIDLCVVRHDYALQLRCISMRWLAAQTDQQSLLLLSCCAAAGCTLELIVRGGQLPALVG